MPQTYVALVPGYPLPIVRTEGALGRRMAFAVVGLACHPCFPDLTEAMQDVHSSRIDVGPLSEMTVRKLYGAGLAGGGRYVDLKRGKVETGWWDIVGNSLDARLSPCLVVGMRRLRPGAFARHHDIALPDLLRDMLAGPEAWAAKGFRVEDAMGGQAWLG